MYMTMEGDNSRDNANSGVPSPAPNVVPATSGANAVNPYNLMAYHPNVFSGKPGQPPPQFYANSVPPGYGGIYVGPQPAMMYAPPFYTGMMPFPGPPFPGQPMAPEPVKTEEKKPQAGERAASPDSSDSDDSQLSKERGAAKRSKASKASHPTGSHRQGEGSAAPNKFSTGSEGANDNEAGAANAPEAWRQRSSSLGGPGGDQNQGAVVPLHPGQDDREQKRQRRKQSNRESARRSRLRKQAECEQLSEKVTLLEAENAALKEENRLLREHFARMGDHSLPGQVQVPAELRQDGAVEGKPPETTAPPVHSAPSAAPPLPITSLPAPLLPTLSRDSNPIPSVGVLSLDGSPDMPGRHCRAPPAAGGQG